MDALTLLNTHCLIKIDTENNKYYRVTETGAWLILPYDEEN